MSDESTKDTEAAEAKPAAEATPPRKTKKAAPSVSARPADPPPSAQPPKAPNIAAFVAIALAAGVGGWFARGASMAVAPDTAVKTTTQPRPVGSVAPVAADMPAACVTWSKAICEGAGEASQGCKSATSAAKLLPAAACESAMPGVAETLGRLEAARGACSTLVTRLCSELGDGTETCKMVREKTASFPAEQCEGMLEEFPQVLAELKKMEAQNAPLTAEVAAAQRAGDAPGFGPADAKVAVVLYSDFQCPFCTRAATVAEALKKKYEDKVRFVFRQFPLSFHKEAKLAAEASLAAHAQGKFWAFHDALFANQNALDRPSLEKYAEQAGLDMARFKKELDDGTHTARVEADMKLGEAVGVSGTPTMLVGTRRVSNPTDPEAVAKLVDEVLAE